MFTFIQFCASFIISFIFFQFISHFLPILILAVNFQTSIVREIQMDSSLSPNAKALVNILSTPPRHASRRIVISSDDDDLVNQIQEVNKAVIKSPGLVNALQDILENGGNKIFNL